MFVVRPAIGEPEAREGKLPQGIAGENREALRIGVVIFLQSGIDGHLLAQQNAFLARRIVVEPVGENRESGGNRPVEQIRLGESELDVLLDIAELHGKRQRFAQPQEIVRLIGKPDESCRRFRSRRRKS